MTNIIRKYLPRIQAVIFDKEGVLVNTIPINRKNAANILARALHSLPAYGDCVMAQTQLDAGVRFYDQHLGNSTESMIKEIITDGAQLKQYTQAYKHARDSELREQIASGPFALLCLGVPELLKKFECMNIPFFIASAASELTDDILTKTGLIKHFKSIKNTKGLPEKIQAIREIISENNFSPGNILFFDDAFNVVESARREFGSELIIGGLPADAETNTRMQKDATFTLPEFSRSGFFPFIEELNQ